MKYRIQLNAVFNNTNSNSILNEVESIKSNVYEAESYTSVPIVRKAEKLDVVGEITENPTLYDSVDFDVSQTTHSGEPEGKSNFKIEVDISFSAEQDYKNFLNYIESIKSNASTDYNRNCRYFECRHEESVPLNKDGAYSYIDFDGEQITH